MAANDDVDWYHQRMLATLAVNRGAQDNVRRIMARDAAAVRAMSPQEQDRHFQTLFDDMLTPSTLFILLAFSLVDRHGYTLAAIVILLVAVLVFVCQ